MKNTKLIDSIIEGNKEKTSQISGEIVRQSNAYEIITESISEALEVVGQKYQTGEYFIPEMLRSARCAELSFGFLKPHIRFEKIKVPAKVVIGTVKGDVHDIGKNIIKTVLESTGFIVYDLGVNVKPQQFIDKIVETDSKILLLSALTTATSLAMNVVIENLKKRNMRKKIKIVIGGVSVNKEFAQEIGADFYGKTIKDTLKYCKKVR